MSDIPEGARDGMTELFDQLLDTVAQWEDKFEGDASLREEIVVNSMCNALCVMAMEYDYGPEFLVKAILAMLSINGAFDEAEPTVH